MEQEQIPLDKLARVYRKIRGKIQELEKEHDNAIEALKAQQDEINNIKNDISEIKAMLAQLLKSN